MVNEKTILLSAEKTGQFTNMLTVVFKHRVPIADYNKFRSPKNYLDYYIEKIWEITQPIGIVYTQEDAYLVVINVEEYTIVVGPASESEPKSEQLEKIAFMMELTDSQRYALVHKAGEITSMPVSTAIYMALADYHMLTGIRLNPSDILRANIRSAELLSVESDKQWQSFCDMDESMMFHETLYQFEKRCCNAIKTGKDEAFERVLQMVPDNVRVIKRGDIRRFKNILIMAATLASRSIIECGVSPAEALTLADYYIDRCEHTDDPDSLVSMMRLMFMRFTSLVRNENQGQELSEFVREINGYIEMHLTGKITVDDMAHDLGMSRNTLSGRFKKETGIVLSEYIMMRKVNRAKYILTNTDLSLSEISAYLSFSSQSHFQRIFKQYAEETPLEYRKKHH